MTNYNYLEAVTSDVLDYIKEEINLDEWKGNREGLEEKLNDELWTVDSVTGNASGSPGRVRTGRDGRIKTRCGSYGRNYKMLFVRAGNSGSPG